MTYTEMQAKWYEFLSNGLPKIAALFLFLVVIKILLNNKSIFKIVVFILFIIPISLMELLNFIKG